MALVVGYSNLIDSATLGGGTWHASYPVTNLQNRFLGQKARLTTTTGNINIDLGSAKPIGVIAMVASNLSGSGAVQFRGSNVAMGNTEAFVANVTGYGADCAVSMAEVSARYWQMGVADASNPSGYFELGRVFIGRRFKPTYPIDFGTSIKVESATTVAVSIGGQEAFGERPNRRVRQFKWSWLTDAEAMTWFGVQRALDVSRETYLVYDDEATLYRAERNWLGRLRELSAIEYPYVSANSTAVEISELL